MSRYFAPPTGKRHGKGPRTKKAKRRHRGRRAATEARDAGLRPSTREWAEFMRRRGLDPAIDG